MNLSQNKILSHGRHTVFTQEISVGYVSLVLIVYSNSKLKLYSA